VREDGSFVRLYPIRFRDLPFEQQYRKYQWIRVNAEKHTGRDTRKESYRPDCDTLEMLGEPIPTKRGDWSERARYVLPQKAQSLEELRDRQEADNTSLGILRPEQIHDLIISEDDPEWKESFRNHMLQMRLFEERRATLVLPRKVPFKFLYHFGCDDERCKGHKMMIEDWEVGALFWRMVDQGTSPDEAAEIVRGKFLDELCGPDRDTHFYVGTVLGYGTWVVIGVWWPKVQPKPQQLGLFG
jgi:hypothetical protein